MARRIKKARVQFISLVPRGANQLPVLYKADGGVDFSLLTKASDNFDENGELLAVVYTPEKEDSQGDIASAEVIKEMMHTSMRDGVQIDVRHDLKALSKDQAYVAESFEIQKGDPRFSGFKDYSDKPVDVTGAWGTVIKIDDAELRKQYRDGKWNGVSLYGKAEVEPVKKSDDDPIGSLLTNLAKRLGLNTLNKDTDMTPEELKAALAANNAELAKVIKEAVTGKPEKTAEELAKEKADAEKAKVDAKPVFKGEPTAENLAKFRKEVALFKITSEIDWTNPESIAKAETAIKALEAEGKEDVNDLAKAAGVEKDDSEEVRNLKIQLHKAQGRSNQPEKKEDDLPEGMSKEDMELIALGKSMAKAKNEERGYVTPKN